MESLRRKVHQRLQAETAARSRRIAQAVGRTTQAAHSSIPVGDADVPLVDAVDTAVTVGAELPAVQEESTQTGVDAWEAWDQSEFAKQIAEGAAQAAEDAQTTADGKSRVVRSTSAATAAGSYSAGDQWWQFSGANIVGLWLHSGTDWVQQVVTNQIIASLDAGKITSGVIAADRIGANSITTAKLASTAIDGMTITGALIRTAPSGQRLQLDVNGLVAYNASGVKVAGLTSGTAGLELRPSSPGDYLQIAPNVLTFLNEPLSKITALYGRSGATLYESSTDPSVVGAITTLGPTSVRLRRQFTHSAGYAVDQVALMRSSGTNPIVSVSGETTAGAAEAYMEVQYGAGGAPYSVSRADRIYVSQIGRWGSGAVEFTSDVSFLGDTDWVRLDGWTGGFAHSSAPVYYRRSRGYVEMIGGLTNSTWAGPLTSFGAVMPAGFRPPQAMNFVMPVNSTVSRTAAFNATGEIRLYGSGTSGAWWVFDMIRYPAAN